MTSSLDDGASATPFIPITARQSIAGQSRGPAARGRLRLLKRLYQPALARTLVWARFAQQIGEKHSLATSNVTAQRAALSVFAPLPLPGALIPPVGALDTSPEIAGPPRTRPLSTPPVVGPLSRALRLGQVATEPPSASAGPISAKAIPAKAAAEPTAPQAALFGQDRARAGQPDSSGGSRSRERSSATPASPVEQAGRTLARMERSSPLVLDHGVRELLARLLGRQLPSVRIYANDAADELTRAAGADALAFADRVVFRRDAYDPQSAGGLALLGHELTHVAAMRAQPAAQAPSVGERAAEEREALRSERQLLGFFADAAAPMSAPPGPSSPTQRSAASRAASYSPLALPPPAEPGPPTAGQLAPAPSSVPAAAAMPPRAAATGRDVGAAPPPAPGLSEADLRRIKDEVYNDLLRRIRTDFERGA